MNDTNNLSSSSTTRWARWASIAPTGSVAPSQSTCWQAQLWANWPLIHHRLHKSTPDGELHHGLCINLIKERISKSPLIYRTQDNINYYNRLCKIEENCDIDCSCHNASNSKIKKQKGGISIYRQKINKIIKDNKRNIKTTKTKYENEKINNNYMFPYLNKNNLENDFLENNNKNTTVNRYDTESLHT